MGTAHIDLRQTRHQFFHKSVAFDTIAEARRCFDLAGWIIALYRLEVTLNLICQLPSGCVSMICSPTSVTQAERLLLPIFIGGDVCQIDPEYHDAFVENHLAVEGRPLWFEWPTNS